RFAWLNPPRSRTSSRPRSGKTLKKCLRPLLLRLVGGSSRAAFGFRGGAPPGSMLARILRKKSNTPAIRLGLPSPPAGPSSCPAYLLSRRLLPATFQSLEALQPADETRPPWEPAPIPA